MTKQSDYSDQTTIEIHNAEITGWIVRQHGHEVAAFSNHIQLCQWLSHHIAPGFCTADEFEDSDDDLPTMFESELDDTIAEINQAAEKQSEPISILSRLTGHKNAKAATA